MQDTLVPTIAAAQLWGHDPASAVLLLGNDCATFTDNPGMSHLPANVPLKDGRLPRAACQDNLARWVPFLFAAPPLLPPHPDACYHELVLGHTHALSLGHWYAHRGAAHRVARTMAHARAGRVPPEVAGPPRAHAVHVWSKLGGQTAHIKPGWDICAAVRGWVAELAVLSSSAALPSVTCSAPATLSPAEQLASLDEATVIVSEHGSTTYLAPFARPGASAIIVGRKEAHVLLGLPDLRVLYVSVEGAMGGEGPGLLALALDTAGQRMGLPALE